MAEQILVWGFGLFGTGILGWVNNLAGFYGAGDLVGYADFAEVQRVGAENYYPALDM